MPPGLASPTPSSVTDVVQPIARSLAARRASRARSLLAMADTVEKSDSEWRDELTPEQYEVLRRKGTERPFTGKYVYNHDDGMYRCAACHAPLFSSDTKFDSGSGWPSFTEPAVAENVTAIDDYSHGMHRIEVVCAHCGGHLGHVFPDGPGENGLRYCINSASLDFDAQPFDLGGAEDPD